MDYTIEMRLVKIKSSAEISKEIELGIYKGDSHVYESIFKEGDNYLGRVSEFGSSLMEKNAVEEFFKELLAKRYGTNTDEVELQGKVKLKNLTDESFPTIARTFDYYTPAVVKKVAQFAQVEEPVAQVIPKPIMQHAHDSLDQLSTQRQFQEQLAAPVQAIVSNISQVRDKIKAVRLAHVPAVETPTEEPISTKMDVNKLISAARADDRFSKLAMFDDDGLHLKMEPVQARDFYKAFDFNPQPSNDPKYLAPVRHELVFKAMKGMCEVHQTERDNASELELDQLLKKQQFEKGLFSYRVREANLNISFDNKLANSNDASEYQQLTHDRKNMNENPELLKKTYDRMVELYNIYMPDTPTKQTHTEFSIKKVNPVEKTEAEKEEFRLSNTVDYSHNERLMAIVNKGMNKNKAQREVEGYRANNIFTLEAMTDLLGKNEALDRTIKLRPNAFDYHAEIKAAFDPSSRRVHNMLMERMVEKGIEPLVLEMPRDFFTNTKYFEAIPSFPLNEPRSHTTGEYIKFYQNMNAGSGNRVDILLDQNINRGIIEAESNMLRSHKQELRDAPYDKADIIVAKHKFEKSFFHWQEQNSAKDDEYKDLQGLLNVHQHYQDYIQVATGLTAKAPFTVEERFKQLQEESEKNGRTTVDSSLPGKSLKSKQHSMELMQSMRGLNEGQNEDLEKVKDKKSVLKNRAAMTLKFS